MAGTGELKNLDLSFLLVDEPKENGIKQSDVLDLSFMAETAPKSPSETAAQIIQKRDEGGFPQGSREGRGFFEKLPDVVTGKDRETSATKNLPELGSEIGLKSLLGEKANPLISGAALTAMNPVELVKIVSENAEGEVSVRPDEAGNIIIGVDGREAIVNKPGFSLFDAMQLGGLMAAFTPSGKLASGGVAASAVKVGLGTAATQAAIETGQSAAGGDFNKADVAVAGAAGATFQALFQGMAKAIPALRKKVADSGITDEVRNTVKKVAIRLGMNADDVTDDVIKQLVNQTDQAVSPEQAFALRGEKEFGIPLTAGQRTLDDTALSFEDRARAGIQGEKAQRIMRGFEQEKQLPAIDAARQSIQGGIGGQPATRQQSGAVIKEGIQKAEAAAAQVVDDAYAQVGDASLKPEGINKLFNATRKAVIGVDKDRSLPETSKLLSQIKRSQKVFVELNKAGAKVKGKHINEIEFMRRRINTAIRSAENNQDRAQIIQMKNAFDDYLDNAVKDALFTGDDAALDALKSSRQIFREYATKFRSNPSRTGSGRPLADKEGAFIEKIIADNPTDEQVVNAIFGAEGFSNSSGANMADRFRRILGDDSEGWKAIRQEAFRRLVKTNKVNGQDVISGQQTLKAIDQAMDKNASLMGKIFTQEEIATFKRFAAQVKRTQPDLVRSRENPSGTAQVLAKSVSDFVKRIGFLSGEPGLIVTSQGVEVLKGISNSGKAKAAVRPFQEIILPKPALVSGSTAATEQVVGGN